MACVWQPSVRPCFLRSFCSKIPSQRRLWPDLRRRHSWRWRGLFPIWLPSLRRLGRNSPQAQVAGGTRFLVCRGRSFRGEMPEQVARGALLRLRFRGHQPAQPPRLRPLRGSELRNRPVRSCDHRPKRDSRRRHGHRFQRQAGVPSSCMPSSCEHRRVRSRGSRHRARRPDGRPRRTLRGRPRLTAGQSDTRSAASR